MRIARTEIRLCRSGPILVLVAVALTGCVDDRENLDVESLKEADAHFAAGRFGQAMELYEASFGRDPELAPYGQLHRTYLALGLTNRARALQVRRRAAGVPEEGPGAWHCDMGMIAIQAGDTAELAVHTDSLAKIHIALQRDPDPRVLECLAFHEVFARRFDDAQSHLESLSLLGDPGGTPPNLAFLYLKQGRGEEANRILSAAERAAAQAAAADPEDPEPHFELAEFAAMRGDVIAAVAALGAAMERGLAQEWWIYQLLDPESISDPVFEPLYGNPDFESIRTEVVEERSRMFLPGADVRH